MEQKNYTLKECRAFSQKRLESTTAFIRGNFANGECKELALPDEAHPWIILHAVIDQYYKREYAMAQSIDLARCEMKRAKDMIEHNKGLDDAYWKMQEEIGKLTKENEQLMGENESLGRNPKSQSVEYEAFHEKGERLEALKDLLQEASPIEWVDSIGEILDGLIMALDYSGCDGLIEQLSKARSLQRFFMELEKETN